MNNIINQNTREQDLALKSQLDGLSPEEKATLRTTIQAEIARRKNPAFDMGGGDISAGAGTGRAIRGLGDQFLQMGGVTPTKDTSNDINSLMMREYVKSAFKPEDPMLDLKKEMATVKLEGEKAKQEATKVNQEEKQQKIADVTENITASAKDMLNTIKTVKEGAKYFGPYGKLPTLATSLGGMVDYEPRKKWENNVNRLLAKKGLDMMVELKNASRTGATGFGQLSEKEGQWLRDASTALTRDISQTDATDILNEMERLYTKVLQGGSKTPTGAAGSDVPNGVDPTDWNAATPQQRQEYLNSIRG